ncbi:hypothetical protein BROUX41_005713 [Berkeleyomyces rouxiae]|uniref:uncharacterized protein n=1 Tax=Berkeleyomyces rouxiae TaxID=2035830 RepID=UPI003B7BBCF5
MSSKNIPDAPFVGQNPGHVANMIEALEARRQAGAGSSKKRGGGSFKKFAFQIAHSRLGIEVNSWKLSDWDYKLANLPTYARGLFTTFNSSQLPEIAVRGYDKFFNINEVSETSWESIKAQTEGPYELTLKENGCIIFISGLEDGSILVCSKHSTGPGADMKASHSTIGEHHLRKQLEKIGLTTEDLARELRARNATAVCELCDDDFEEHVLKYGPEQAGLYLHGINLNLPEFMTYPSALVQEFATKWNFKKTDMLIMHDIEKVREYLDNMAESGAYEGRDIEGFVIRCKKSPAVGAPYADWFFKYKFEEPYLMYRQWREYTKTLIAGNKPRITKHKTITEKYLFYVKKRMAKDPTLAENYLKNHGIIALRDDFLASESLKGSDAANIDGDDKSKETFPEVNKDVVITAIATIGCGKTTIGLALVKLFGWGHIQNDNISGSKRPPRFVAALKEDLKKTPVVFADRNNAQRHERKQLITDMRLSMDEPTLVALNFKHSEESIEDIRKLTQERVLKRGDNHQTIQAATDAAKFLGVMNSFLNRYEALDPDRAPDAGFDYVIDLDPLAGSRVNLGIVVKTLHEIYPTLVPKMPCEETLDSAMRYALEYKPEFRHNIPNRGNKASPGKGQQQTPKAEKQKKPNLEYMAINVSKSTLDSTLQKTFSRHDVSSEHTKLYNYLREANRIQSSFHVTLLHRAGAKEHPELWQKYKGLFEKNYKASGEASILGTSKVLLERVVFNDKIMAIVVRLHDPTRTWVCTNRVAHITVGTYDNNTKPRESNDLLAQWLEGGTSETIKEIILEDKPEIEGVVMGMSGRF